MQRYIRRWEWLDERSPPGNNEKMKPAVSLISLLICAIVLVDFAFALASRQVGVVDSRHPLRLAVVALAFSQIGALGLFVVFGRWRLLVRCVIAAMVVVAWGWLIVWSDLRSVLGEGEWTFYFFAELFLIAGLLSVFRWRGVRLERPNEWIRQAPVNDHSTAWQFPLRRIMLWTAVVAVVLAARHLIDVPSPYLFTVSCFLITNAMIAGVALWVVLGTPKNWAAPAAAAVVGICLAATLRMALGAHVQGLAGLTVAEFMLVAAMATVARISGYRLIRLKKTAIDNPPDSSAESDRQNGVHPAGAK